MRRRTMSTSACRRDSRTTWPSRSRFRCWRRPFRRSPLAQDVRSTKGNRSGGLIHSQMLFDLVIAKIAQLFSQGRTWVLITVVRSRSISAPFSALLPGSPRQRWCRPSACVRCTRRPGDSRRRPSRPPAPAIAARVGRSRLLVSLSTPRGDGLPPLHARLASGCWSQLCRTGFDPQGFYERFLSISARPPFPSFHGASFESDDNLVEGNLIGTDYSGTEALGNIQGGISIGDAATFNT